MEECHVLEMTGPTRTPQVLPWKQKVETERAFSANKVFGLKKKGKKTDYLVVLWSFCRVPTILRYFVLNLPVDLTNMQT